MKVIVASDQSDVRPAGSNNDRWLTRGLNSFDWTVYLNSAGSPTAVLRIKLIATGGLAVGSDSVNAWISCGGTLDCMMLNLM